MNYQELKQKHQKEVNDFLKDTAFFAFDKKQFDEGIKKLNASSDNKIFELGAGGYMLSSAKNGWIALCKRQKQELKDFRQKSESLKELIMYELNKHEYIYSEDDDLILEACEISKDEFEKDTNLQKIYKQAKKEYWQKSN